MSCTISQEFMDKSEGNDVSEIVSRVSAGRFWCWGTCPGMKSFTAQTEKKLFAVLRCLHCNVLDYS